MLTLTDINRALDRLGVEAFIPRTRRQPVVRVDGGSVHIDRDPERAVQSPRRRAVVLAAIEATPDFQHPATDGELETIVPSQFADLLRNDEARPPERRLMLAVLEDALRSYERYASSARQRGRRLFREAEEWFASDAATWPFSFVIICETLDLEPEYVRAGLRARRPRTRPSSDQAPRSSGFVP
jgi:hypothetical protein